MIPCDLGNRIKSTKGKIEKHKKTKKQLEPKPGPFKSGGSDRKESAMKPGYGVLASYDIDAWNREHNMIKNVWVCNIPCVVCVLCVQGYTVTDYTSLTRHWRHRRACPCGVV